MPIRERGISRRPRVAAPHYGRAPEVSRSTTYLSVPSGARGWSGASARPRERRGPWRCAEACARTPVPRLDRRAGPPVLPPRHLVTGASGPRPIGRPRPARRAWPADLQCPSGPQLVRNSHSVTGGRTGARGQRSSPGSGQTSPRDPRATFRVRDRGAPGRRRPGPRSGLSSRRSRQGSDRCLEAPRRPADTVAPRPGGAKRGAPVARHSRANEDRPGRGARAIWCCDAIRELTRRICRAN